MTSQTEQGIKKIEKSSYLFPSKLMSSAEASWMITNKDWSTTRELATKCNILLKCRLYLLNCLSFLLIYHFFNVLSCLDWNYLLYYNQNCGKYCKKEFLCFSFHISDHFGERFHTQTLIPRGDLPIPTWQSRFFGQFHEIMSKAFRILRHVPVFV